MAQAEGGTLFLDEVGDLPLALQVKLLRFLEERSYEPLGSNTPVRADVRVITATHRDLSETVRKGAFRQDLLFRLNVLEIHLPPLRKRPEDIPLLCRHFIQRFREATGKAIDSLSPEAMALLLQLPFPGNLRELENIIERAFILRPGREIGPDCLPFELAGGGSSSRTGPERAGNLEILEAEAIRAALLRHGGNRSRAARELGIHRTTLLRKLKALRLEEGP